MIKTQVQIPDRLYAEAKRVAKEHEISFAEVVRRGLEQVTRTHPPGRRAPGAWRLPDPVDLGEVLAPEEEWEQLCH